MFCTKPKEHTARGNESNTLRLMEEINQIVRIQGKWRAKGKIKINKNIKKGQINIKKKKWNNETKEKLWLLQGGEKKRENSGNKWKRNRYLFPICGNWKVKESQWQEN